MAINSSVTPIKISGAAGLLAAVPVLMGFHPRESLVVLGMQGPRRRLCPVIRVDLPQPAEADALIDLLVRQAAQHVDRVAVLCYSDLPSAHGLLARLLDRCRAAGMDVMDAIVARADRAEFLPDDDGVTDPPIALPDDDHPTRRALAGAVALNGRGVLADREQLRASIAGPRGNRLRAARRAIGGAAAELADLVADAGPDQAVRSLVAAGRATMARALAELAQSRGVGPDTAGLLALSLHQVTVRDDLIARIVTDRETEWLPALIAAAAGVPDDVAAELCSVLAVAAYRAGDGALAQIAVDRCLRGDPEHRLAHLMLGVMASGMHPDLLEGLSGAPEEN